MFYKKNNIRISITLLIIVLLISALFYLLDFKNNSSQQNDDEIYYQTSFERKKTYNSGLFFKGKKQISCPSDWKTMFQHHNSSTGWNNEEAHQGGYSLEINNIGCTNTFWKGPSIIIKNPIKFIEASVWAKSSNDKCPGAPRLKILAFTKNEAGNWVRKVYDYKLKLDGQKWKQSRHFFIFSKPVTKIIPCLNYSNLGTVYFDDLLLRSPTIKPAVVFKSISKNDFSGSFQVKKDSKGDKIFSLESGKHIISTKYIPVDTNNIYHLSGFFKSSTKIPGRIYLGLIPYTKNKKQIFFNTFNHVSRSETELAKPCNPKDRIIYIKDGSSWKPQIYGCIAFDIDNSGKFADLPNFKLSPPGIKKVIQEGKLWKVVLKHPVNFNRQAGTKVREHFETASGSYLFCSAWNKKLSPIWQKYSGTVKKGLTIQKSFNKFPPNTKYVKIIILASSSNTLEISCLKFKKIKLSCIKG